MDLREKSSSLNQMMLCCSLLFVVCCPLFGICYCSMLVDMSYCHCKAQIKLLRSSRPPSPENGGSLCCLEWSNVTMELYDRFGRYLGGGNGGLSMEARWSTRFRTDRQLISTSGCKACWNVLEKLYSPPSSHRFLMVFN